MKWRAVVCLLAFFSFTGAAFAQETPKFEISAGYPTFAIIPALPACQASIFTVAVPPLLTT